jgi:hypothetical protein
VQARKAQTMMEQAGQQLMQLADVWGQLALA